MARVQIKELVNTTQQVTATVNYITKANGKQIVKLTHVYIGDKNKSLLVVFFKL